MARRKHTYFEYPRIFDVFNNTTGAVVIRNVTVDDVVSTYQTSRTAEQVLRDIAAYSYSDADGYRVTRHFQIGY
jgi:hypothetical protein